MSKRRSIRRAPSQPNFIINAFKSIKFDFVLAIIIVILYISASVRLSLEKVIIIIVGPVVAELILLGIDQYLIAWIRGAVPIRSLVTSIFGVLIGAALITVNSEIMIVGLLVIVLSALLTVWALWKYRSTKDFGIRSANPISTANTALFMTGLLLLTLGYVDFFVLILFCSLIVMVYSTFPFSAVLTFISAAIFYTVFASILYVLIIVAVEIAVQGFRNRAAIVLMIRGASLLRTLITSVFGIIIGKAMAVGSSAALIPGITIIALSVLLTIYGVRKLMATRDLGLKGQDPIATANLVILFVSVLALILGILNLFVFLISCWAIVFFYRQTLFEIPVILVALIMVQGLLSWAYLTNLILVVGIVMAALGVILKRVETERIKSTAKAKAATSKQGG